MGKDLLPNSILVLGENLKFLHRREGGTNEDYAKKLGYDRVCLGRLFYGDQNLKLSSADRIAEKTGYALTALVNNSFADDSEYRESQRYHKTDLLKLFLKHIDKQMQTERISQADICSSLEMDKAALSRILSGQIKDPTLATLSCIAVAVNSDLSTALREEQE